MIDHIDGVPAKVKVAMHILSYAKDKASPEMIKESQALVEKYLKGNSGGERRNNKGKITRGQEMANSMGY